MEWVLEKLDALGPVRARKMFGGHGLFFEGVMFAPIAYDILYFKTDDQADPFYDGADCPHFEYGPRGKKPFRMSYRRCPDTALDDEEAILHWAQIGLDAALRTDLAKPPSKRTRKI